MTESRETRLSGQGREVELTGILLFAKVRKVTILTILKKTRLLAPCPGPIPHFSLTREKTRPGKNLV